MNTQMSLGSAEQPVRIAIVGSGPSGFYAAEALLQSTYVVEITMIERLPVPHGLVRSGVAPDHPKLKQSTLVFDKIAAHPRFHFLGNVEVGRDISIDDLLRTHHGIVFAYGASLDRRVGIEGEDLPGSHSATEFVGWYNGHPDYRDLAFDLDQEAAVIIGQGNVALDVARILSKPVDSFRHTDIAEHALDALSKSRLREIHVVGRRGPAQAKFTPTELREFGTISECAARVDPEQLALDEVSQLEASDKRYRNIATNLGILAGFGSAAESDAARRCYFHFLRNPVEVLGEKRVTGIRFAKTRLVGEAFHQSTLDTIETVDIDAGLLFRSVGYRGRPILDLPFNAARGTLRHLGGRLVGEDGTVCYGLYATGWIKRGPNGIIGTNRADSLETVATLLTDMPHLVRCDKSGAIGVAEILQRQGKRYVSYQDWSRINAAEIARGELTGKPREKFARVAEMLAACMGAESAQST
ncbi:NADPH-ferredoxin reductase FprA (plasmid) [Caballeronia sp. SBC1]|uniref:FAD-dependent oxidoreductase n=1 Tax=unclassified Caballeronia TaxID=2646786 RepID=UPI0013E0F641|nr:MULTISPECIES: FAD-dependent oxidoreductase [unclassified Caballeronia]QIE27197.1 NADPH-ferredoxin reductase FprA [Caballeronia sp. SBC2]QIN65324.1 NADPH-ferredoxin reductase FprA [Caballeronia sp. SBC1]